MSHTKLRSLHTPQTLYHIIIQHLQEILEPSTQNNHFFHFTIFAGLLPLQWQPTDEITNPSVYHKAPHQWTIKFSPWLTKQGHNLWQLRNRQAHDDQDEQVSDLLLNQKIAKLYRLQDDLSHYDRNIFQQPIEEKYCLTTKQKTEWIEQTTQTVYKCIAEHHQKMTQGQTDIRNFFNSRREAVKKKLKVWVLYSRREYRDKTIKRSFK